MPMTEDGYDGGPMVEGGWGCIAAALLGVPIFILLLLVDALGDCVPDTACKKGFLTQVLLPAALISIGVGLLVRWVVKTARQNHPD